MASLFFGNSLAWLFLGFLAVQTYTYYTRSSNDHPVFKTLVYCSVLIATTETAAAAFVAYCLLVSGWGNPLVLAEPSRAFTTLLGLQPLFDAPPALFVQFFFTWRIWTFCMAVCRRKVKLLVAAICIFLVITSVGSFISGILLIVVQLDTKTPLSVTSTILVRVISIIVVDLIITTCMMVILFRAKNTSYFGETRDRISRLIRLTIQTGLLTTVLAIPIAPLFYFNQQGLVSLTCFFLGKSYVISVLANLNARSHRSYPGSTKEGIEAIALPPLSSIHFTPIRFRQEVVDVTSGQGALSFIRSIARTIHNDLSEDMPTSSQETSTPISLRDSNSVLEEKGSPPGLVEVKTDGNDEVNGSSSTPNLHYSPDT